MKLLLLLLAAPIVTLSTQLATAQNNTTATQDTIPAKTGITQKTKNVFTLTANYQTRLNYYGRVDSFKSSGFFPTAEYQLKCGLYASSTLILVQNSTSHFSYTGALAEAGYRFPESKHFEGNISAAKFIYKDNSTLVQSALKAQTGFSITWKNKILNVTAGASARFSDETDFSVNGALNHLFIWKLPHQGSKALAIALNPTATINAGTQKFNNTYSKKQSFLGFPVLPAQTLTEQSKAFNILSYEFSMPVVWVIGKCFLAATPAYVLPQHLLTASNSTAAEKGSNLFYTTFTAGFKL